MNATELRAWLLSEVGKKISAARRERLMAALAAIQEVLDEEEVGQAAEAKKDPDVGGGVDRSKLPASDFAGKNRSYPIVTPADVSDAVASLGRAGPDNYSVDELKRRIIAICQRKGAAFMAALPDAWKAEMAPGQAKASEAAEEELVGEVVPLVEARALGPDGALKLKVIAPGWGSSGHYSAEVLKRDGPAAFHEGLQMFWDHPTASDARERPERSLRDLMGVLKSDAVWQDDGPAGPGLYADAKVFEPYRQPLAEMAPYIGVSIRATGTKKLGEAEGKTGPLIDAITAGQSVDAVTVPGAGGQILQLFEAARGRAQPEEEVDMGALEEAQARLAEAERAAAAKDAALAEAERELARLREAALLREARDYCAEVLAAIDMPALTRARLVEALAAKPVVKDGALDRAAYKTAVEEAARAELEYIGKLTGQGQVKGLGSAPGEKARPAALEESYRWLYRSQGHSQEQAERLAALAAR